MKYLFFIFSFNSLFAFTSNDLGRTITALADVGGRGLITGESHEITEILTSNHARLSSGYIINFVHNGSQWEFSSTTDPVTVPPVEDNSTSTPSTNEFDFLGNYTDEATLYYIIEGTDYWGGVCDYVFGITFSYNFRFLSTGGFCTITPTNFFIHDLYFQTGQIKTSPGTPFSWIVQFQSSEIGLYDSNNNLINPLSLQNDSGSSIYRIPVDSIDKELNPNGTVNFPFSFRVGIKGTYVVVSHVGNSQGQRIPSPNQFDHLQTYNVNENISISVSDI